MESPTSLRRKESSPKSMPVTAVTGREAITEERIRMRAYQCFQERQRAGLPDDPVANWLQAERELKTAWR
jgi:hypothetical protein